MDLDQIVILLRSFPDKGWVGVLVKDNHNVNDGTRALRDLYASSRSPL